MEKRTAPEKRNTGIDLLRIIAMFYIVVLHSVGRGGLIDRHLYFSWFLFTWTVCAVNCFALISGYVGYSENKPDRIRLSRYISLWLQVVFYGIAISAVYRIIMPEKVDAGIVLSNLLPVSTNKYWYFTAYTGLFFCTPIINACIRSLDEKKIKYALWVFFFLFSLYATVAAAYKEPFSLQQGYSFVWLCMMYFLGAAIKKLKLFDDLGQFCKIALIFILVFISEGWVVSGTYLRWDDKLKTLLIQYVSPTIMMISVLHLLFFKNLTIGSRAAKLIEIASPGAFAVYLINTHPLVWDYSMKNRFAFLMDKPAVLMPIFVIAFSALFVVLSLLIDFLRQKLFGLLKIDKAIVAFSMSLESMGKRLIK